MLRCFARSGSSFRVADPMLKAYLGMVEIAELGEAGVSAAIIGVLGNEALIGRNLARRFRITLTTAGRSLLNRRL
jgi:hypothetical protein